MGTEPGKASKRLMKALEALCDEEVTLVLRSVVAGARRSPDDPRNAKMDELRLALKMLHETHRRTKKSERTLQVTVSKLRARVDDLEHRARVQAGGQIYGVLTRDVKAGELITADLLS